MNFDQYFKLRADLAVRLLVEVPGAHQPDGGWRFFSAGVATLAFAIATEVWMANTQIDPGFFSVTSAFLRLVLFTGIGLLAASLASEYSLARLAITSREGAKHKAVAQLLDVDGAVAAKLAERGGGR